MDERLRCVIPLSPFNPLMSGCEESCGVRQLGSLSLQASRVPEQGREVREQIAQAPMVTEQEEQTPRVSMASERRSPTEQTLFKEALPQSDSSLQTVASAKMNIEGRPSKPWQKRSGTGPRRRVRLSKQCQNGCGPARRLHQMGRHCSRLRRGPAHQMKWKTRTLHGMRVNEHSSRKWSATRRQAKDSTVGVFLARSWRRRYQNHLLRKKKNEWDEVRHSRFVLLDTRRGKEVHVVLSEKKGSLRDRTMPAPGVVARTAVAPSEPETGTITMQYGDEDETCMVYQAEYPPQGNRKSLIEL